MAHLVKRIPRGTTEKVDAYAGPSGELVMDTTTNDLVLETGVAGGVRLAKASTVIAATNGVQISAGGTLASGATVSGVDATTSAKGVVRLESATNSASETTAATPKAVSDALQAAKDYADSKVETYTGAAPIAVNASNEISISAATQSAAGSMSAADKTKLDGIVDMTGAGASTAGVHGLVPAPAAGDNAKFLKGDGTWAAAGETYTAAAPLSIDANNEISISAATTTDAGSMSAADKTKLDGITTMTGATSVAAGASGLVPAPAAGDDTAFLKGDGTWGTPPGKTYTATAPVAIDANDDISVADATTSSKGVVQVGDNVTVNDGTISVKPWTGHETASTDIVPANYQDGAIIETDEPVGGSATAVLAEVEQALSGQAAMVPSSAAVKEAIDTVAATQGLRNIYLSPSGSDSNDGRTPSTAVATFDRAMKLAREQSYLATDVLQKQTIVVAAGSYTEDVTVDGFEQKAKYKFYLDGAVSITGDVTIANSTAVAFTNGNLTVAGKIAVKNQSYCYVGETLTVVADGGTENNAITVTDGSFLQCASNVSVSGTGYNAIECSFSRLSVSGDATFAGTWANRLIAGVNSSSVTFTNVKSSGVEAKAVVTATNCSYVSLGIVDIVITGSPTTTIFGSSGDATLVMSTVTFSGSTNSSHDIFSSITPSTLAISGAITVISNGTTSATRPRSIFCAEEGGLIRLAANTATHTINANVYSAVVYAVLDGHCSIYTSANFAGTVTGKKYALGTGGRILKGASKLNGSAEGTLDTATYCFAAN